jgi:three-Cys-motif partner protein
MTKHTSLGTEADFFSKLREGSRVKQRIVSEYFLYYCSLMSRHREKVGYADLFAGPGWYSNEQGLLHKSTPILVCEAVIRDPALRQKVHLWFNDGDNENYVALKSGVESLAGCDTLRYKPAIQNRKITARWAETMKKLPVPTLVFLDPCGYKGLSLRLVTSVLEGFGNDCILFQLQSNQYEART